ncbi:PREDICTED: uncharacterized protein LOC108361017 isoform X1 [Rhagoletis zephyria]|uniref:uncharacterized protein LOC108361017 isoform X1 n=2 Tax=Rhagoletis zephyria TaxID=28612 RepID=UPI0008116472|nr:PREDICTED: uncharacterized protein LOC108361017 isoform X1 [Rhagoletis zephyria]
MIWADYKSNIKAKLRRNKESMSGTGGGPSRFCSLTATEEQVVALLNIDESINGETETMRFGATTFGDPASSSPLDCINLEPEEYPSNDAENQPPNAIPTTPPIVIAPPNRARSLPLGKDNLLKLQVENQCQYHENSMKKLDEVCDNLNSLSRYFKRNVELEEAKLQLKREKFEFFKKNEKKKRKLKLKALKLKAKLCK